MYITKYLNLLFNLILAKIMSDNKEEAFKAFVFKCLRQRLEDEYKKFAIDRLKKRLMEEDDISISIKHENANKIIHAYRKYKLKKQLKLLATYSISLRYNRMHTIDTHIEHSKTHINLYDALNKLEV